MPGEKPVMRDGVKGIRTPSNEQATWQLPAEPPPAVIFCSELQFLGSKTEKTKIIKKSGCSESVPVGETSLCAKRNKISNQQEAWDPMWLNWMDRLSIPAVPITFSDFLQGSGLLLCSCSSAPHALGAQVLFLH
jgi:hypothetical protein